MKPKRIINPFEGIEARVDVISEVQTEGVNPFEELLNKYEAFLNVRILEEKDYDFFTRTGGPIAEILLPEQMNQFLQMTSAFETHSNYQENTGVFLSRLVQNSYNAGHNNFCFDLTKLPRIDGLFAYVSGQKERLLYGVINGTFVESGNYIGAHAQYSHLVMQEAGFRMGNNAKHSTFTCTTGGDEIGSRAKYCTFTLQKAGEHLGLLARSLVFIAEQTAKYAASGSEECTFILGEATSTEDIGRTSLKSIYKTRDRALLNELVLKIPSEISTIENDQRRRIDFTENRVIYINPDGSEEVYRS